MVRIGIVGLGFMGMTHFEGSTKFKVDPKSGLRKIAGSKLKNGKVVAFATRDEARRNGDWTSIQGNFGPRGERNDLSGVAAYADYAEMLKDPNIDLIDVCLPPDMHEKVVLDAIAAKKHVIVEKPIAIDVAAADRMVKAAEKAGVMLMVAQVLPFFPEFAFAAESIKSGTYGKLKAAHFRRVICQPDWSAALGDFKKSGGWGIDLHIHDNHFINSICGTPREVFSRGSLVEGFINHVHTSYVYEDPSLAVTAVSGGIAAKGLQFAHGFELYLEDATILYGGGTYAGEWVLDRPLTLITNSGKKVTQPKLKAGTEWCSAFTAELQTAVNSVESGTVSPMLSGTMARDALKLCYAEAKSIASGRLAKVSS